jgi:hypothetical protein
MGKRKRKRRVTWEDAISVCAWCGRYIPEGSEIFSLGARVRPGVDLGVGGNVLELTLDATRKALAIIPTEESDAKQAGWDILFAICSEECAWSLKETLQGQIDFIDSSVLAA